MFPFYTPTFISRGSEKTTSELAKEKKCILITEKFNIRAFRLVVVVIVDGGGGVEQKTQKGCLTRNRILL